MTNYNKLYINGDWVNPKGTKKIAVSNPADEKIISEIIFANKDDLDLAVLSAKKAFNSFSTINLEEKIELFNSIIYFPSSTLHEVCVNTSKRNRISLAFNVFVKGEFGSDAEVNRLTLGEIPKNSWGINL